MVLSVNFFESEQKFSAKFGETLQPFEVSFSNVVIVERTDIPKEYGRITYDQNKTITVS